jgi:ATP-dependent Clp protease ATP-binding subunit ClpC
VFRQLSQAENFTFADLMIAKMDERLKDRDMGGELLPAAKTLPSGPATIRCSARGRCAA